MAIEDLKGMLQGMLDKKKADKETADLERQQKNDGDRNKILENISGDLSKSLSPVLEQLAKNSKLSTDDIRQALAEAIQINLPEIKMPDIPAPVVNVPAPIVHIASPTMPAPVVKVSPTPVSFPEEMSLKAGSRPFPVIMMDQGGKPMQFPQMSGGATGGRGDFFAIRDIQTSSGASIIDQVDGTLKISGNLTVSASNSSTQAIDSSGNPYSAANPLPTTATISLPAGPGDGATATRIIQAGDTVSSVIVNSGTITTVTTLTGITNTIAVNIVDSSGVAYEGANALPVVGDSANGAADASNRPVGIGGRYLLTPGTYTDGNRANLLMDVNGRAQVKVSSPIDQGDVASAVRVVLAGNSDASVVVNSGTITTVTTLTGITNTIAVAHIDSSGVQYSGSNGMPVLVTGQSDSMLTYKASTTMPTALADGADSRPRSDKYNRPIFRPLQVRDLLATAYVSLSTGTEATLLAASAGKLYDLVWVLMSNQSTAAVQVDIRPITAGNILMTFQVPANGTVGIAPPLPLPGGADTGNNWTVDMPDVTGTTVNITGLFSQEI